MSTKVSAIQAIIEKRANKKLDEELLALSKIMREHHLISDASGPQLAMLVNEASRKEASAYFIFRYERSSSDPRSGHIFSSVYMDQLRAYWLPKFIEREAESLVQKVDDLGYTDVDQTEEV